jgi:hypothetical protein
LEEKIGGEIPRAAGAIIYGKLSWKPFTKYKVIFAENSNRNLSLIEVYLYRNLSWKPFTKYRYTYLFRNSHGNLSLNTGIHIYLENPHRKLSL